MASPFKIPLKIRADKLLVAFLALLVALPGYYFTEVSDSGQTVNNTFRFGVVFSILLMISGRLFFLRKIKVPKITAVLFAFVAYSFLIGVVKNPPVSYVPTGVRWLIYFSCVVLFFNIKGSLQLLRKYYLVTFLVYTCSAFLDIVSGRIMDINSAIRVVGSVGSAPGLAAAIYVSAIGCLFFNLRKTRNLLFIIFTAMTSILLTKTRFILVSFTFVVVLYLALVAEKGVRLKIIVSILVLLTGMTVYMINSSDIMQRFIVSAADLESDSSSLFRLLILNTLWDNFRGGDLITGLGLGYFPLWFENMTGQEGVAPHFEIVGILTEAGLIGLLLYLAGLLKFLVRVYRNCRKTSNEGLFYLTALLLLSIQTSLQFANPTYFYQVMMPVFLTVGALLQEIAKKMIPVHAIAAATEKKNIPDEELDVDTIV